MALSARMLNRRWAWLQLLLQRRLAQDVVQPVISRLLALAWVGALSLALASTAKAPGSVLCGHGVLVCDSFQDSPRYAYKSFRVNPLPPASSLRNQGIGPTAA